MPANTNHLAATFVGGSTVKIEINGLRLLTDPIFEPAGTSYHVARVLKFLPGGTYTRLTNPAVSVEEVGEIDAVLLTHDQHADHLDTAGRTLLPKAQQVLTTPGGARRLGVNSIGMKPWDERWLESPSGARVKITATPCRHGPPLSRPLVGEVVGFVLEWEGQQNGAVWISGDTVWYRGIEEIIKRFQIGTAIINVGAGRFRLTGRVRYTFDAVEAGRFAKESDCRCIVPVHYEGWSNYSEGRDRLEEVFAKEKMSDRLRWLPYGQVEVVET